MSTFALTNATVFLGGIDLGQHLNKITIDAKTDELEDTRFNSSGYRSRIGGLKDFTIAHEGFMQYSEPDATMFADLGAQNVITVSPTPADGEVAYFGNAKRFEYAPLDGTVGEVCAFAGNVMASDAYGLIRGQLLLPSQTVTGNVNGTGQQLGLVAAGRYLYTAIHCTAAGTTATVIVESDDNSGFTSAVTRSSTVVTATGGTFVTRVAGAIASDTYWRVRIASVTGTFVLAAAVGIAA